MNSKNLATGVALIALAALGCGASPGPGAAPAPPVSVAAPPAQRAIARIDPKSESAVTGSATFTAEGPGIVLEVSLEHAPPGEHALHIHEVGNCDSPDGSSAGAHWNPTSEAHGMWGHAPHHLGDIGNLTVGADGKGSLVFRTERWSMGTGAANEILERSVIVHQAADDFTTQPTGAAGGRIGCGVIRIPS